MHSHQHNIVSISFNRGGDPVVRQIVNEDEGHKILLIATELGLAHTTEDNEPCVVDRFDRRSSLHLSLPGAERASKRDYVSTAVVPADKLEQFVKMTGKVEAARQAAAL